jgi:ABC-type multidrug transport system ATPase subunit
MRAAAPEAAETVAIDTIVPAAIPPPPPPPDPTPTSVRKSRGGVVWLGGAPLITATDLSLAGPDGATVATTSFTLRTGEVAVLAGPGSRPLARVLLGLAKPAGGVIDGPLWTGALHPVPARFNPRDNLTVEENLVLVMAGGRPAAGVEAERAASMADLVGLGHRAGVRAGMLSESERRLLILAASFSRDAGVAILHSPTATMQEADRLTVERAVRHLAKSGRAFVLLAGSLAEARTIATTVLLMEGTRTVHESIETFIAHHAPAAHLTMW